ncbi:unnamed protein product [Miscanthus lutarioriparius]|uniref:Uncharacterized protein n=1 Tax=Miscanthus lutarioriparius TaxID=422564 RepID=A0A811QC37_9POAL|nr:unnamed protein product [Miscanthus lutarioriparius]
MAEFALGLTKMAVEGTVSRVKLAIEEEGKLRVRVENDLVFITGEFQMMQSLLKMANVKGAKNEVVRTWLRQVRDLAFDVEDCIEFVVHLDKKSAWGWLRRLGRMVVSCNAPPLPLDQAVDDIRRLKARVEDVSQRNTRYNLIVSDDSGSGSGSNSKAVSMQATPGAAAAAAAFRTLREVWEVTGKWRSTGDLQKLVMASLFSKMYNDPAIFGEFRTRAWVKLMHPFNPDEFLKCLLSQLHACSHQMDIDMGFWRRMKVAMAEEEDGLTKAKLMQEVMSRHRYLIVLEEVFSVIEWNVIKMYLPDSENGSRIVVSTRQLEVALLTTGKPYQVSELKHFSDDQSLCAFSKKYGRRSGKGELIWQIRCRGVISVFGNDAIKTTLVNKVYTRIVHKWKQLEGLEFERHSWVDVPVPFNLEVFSRRLLLSLCSEDHISEEIAAIGVMRDPCLTEECCKFLHELDCLLVINGLQSTHDWDSIKAAFLSEPTKGCILVITNEASVSTHCAQEEGAVLNMEDMKADVMLRPLLKGSEHCERGGVGLDDRGRPFSVRREQAREWLRQFGPYCRKMDELDLCLRNPGVISLWGPGAGKSALIRWMYWMYYDTMVRSEASWESGYEKQPINLPDRTEKFSWVHVPHPFDLTEFSCRLLLDFHSDDHRSKKTAALSMMEEGQDSTEECCKFLCKYQCLVVIDGIQSTHEWDTIKVSFLSKPMKGSIVVITDEATVATYCVNHEEHRVIKVNNKDLDGAPSPPVKDCPSHLFSNRRGEARNWTNKYRLLGHQNGSAHLLSRGVRYSCPGVTSVWGIAGIGKSIVVRSVYCHLMLVEQWLKYREHQVHVLVWNRQNFTMYSWADVPHPFNLTDLSWRLLRDFYSDDLDAKSTAAIGIMEGQDPIQECRRYLREHRCLVVIDGLRSKDDWELIKAAFLPDSTKACIVVITNEESVARHCVDNKEHQLVNVKGLEADRALDLFKEGDQLPHIQILATFYQQILVKKTKIRGGQAVHQKIIFPDTSTPRPM